MSKLRCLLSHFFYCCMRSRCLHLLIMWCCQFSKAFVRTTFGMGKVSGSLTQTQRQLTTNLIVVGKRNGGEEWISSGYAEYEKRLKPIMTLHTTYLKSDDELIQATKSSKGFTIALDEKGKQLTSLEFTEMLYSSFEKGGATVNFIVGGFAGLPAEIRSNYPLISLSKLTWTHTMARLLLTEQIYRATEIRKGSGYHKE